MSSAGVNELVCPLVINSIPNREVSLAVVNHPEGMIECPEDLAGLRKVSVGQRLRSQDIEYGYSYLAPGNVNVKSMTTCEGNHLLDME